MIVEATRDGFYAELTRRNAGFVPASTQAGLRRVRVLVAGCGSTGGAVVGPLARLGVERFVLADNGTYELNNLNRQDAGTADLGRHKAAVCAERIAAVNPHAEVTVCESGITEDTVDALMTSCDVVLDGVDVTEAAGWRAKFALHASAARHGRPVVTGYDMAGAQYVRYYDYGRDGRPFAGRITAEAVAAADPWSLLRRAIPLRFVPTEMIGEVRAHLGEEAYSVPQLVYASLAFGALASRMVVDVVEGRRPRRHSYLDVHRSVRRRGDGWRLGLRRPALLVTTLAALARPAGARGGAGQAGGPRRPG